tara:strand:- start:723 stop:1604 length:882 start_codon:yes stop_codon:yes gene_type:complete
MNKSFSISFLLIFYCSILFAQNNINSYKYILVPKQFEFQKLEDQYQLNSLTKFLFNKAGYTVLFTDENYPVDIATNSCLGLKTKVNDNSSFLKTKTNIELYDCYNNLVYATKEGVSKEKDYKIAYHEAIRNSFTELSELNYTYAPVIVATKEEVAIPVAIETPKIKKAVEVKEVITKPITEEVIPIVENKKIKVVEVIKSIPLNKVDNSIKTIEGKFHFNNWGTSTISIKEDYYVVVGGDENFEFATIYKTSKPTVFIIKWLAYKQPQLLVIDNKGNLEVDSENGVTIYQRLD